jgi:O-acetylhomoserine (thiol)-lyase
MTQSSSNSIGSPDPDEPGFSTAQVHAGQAPDASYGSRITPIHLSAGFAF